jgi:hypothetical protein
MARVCWYFVGSLVLIALVGCGRSPFEQREAWRHDAEVACLKSGAVKENSALVRIQPIDGPGICGADFPLRVAALGSAIAMSYSDHPQPPASIPASRGREPPWPLAQPESSQPPRFEPASEPAGAPISIHPPGLPHDDDAAGEGQEVDRPAPAITSARPFYRPATSIEASPPTPGPPAGQRITAAIGPVAIKPAATLACPIVSALDQWIMTAVQPAALRWFGQPVVGIRQISAYSCRGMNGSRHARISEHAFGNALDVAAFTLADGRIVTIKRGWHGTPEEQGFLRDVQGAACQGFSTVLAPGSNRFHYDHMHVDLMRRRSGRVVCKPSPMPGEVAAARAAQRGRHARHGDPLVTGTITAYAGREDEGRLANDDEDWIEHDGPRAAAE